MKCIADKVVNRDLYFEHFNKQNKQSRFFQLSEQNELQPSAQARIFSSIDASAPAQVTPKAKAGNNSEKEKPRIPSKPLKLPKFSPLNIQEEKNCGTQINKASLGDSNTTSIEFGLISGRSSQRSMRSSCYKQKSSKSPVSKTKTKRDSMIHVGIKAGNKYVLPQYLPASLLAINNSVKDFSGRNGPERMLLTDEHFVLSSA